MRLQNNGFLNASLQNVFSDPRGPAKSGSRAQQYTARTSHNSTAGALAFTESGRAAITRDGERKERRPRTSPHDARLSLGDPHNYRQTYDVQSLLQLPCALHAVPHLFWGRRRNRAVLVEYCRRFWRCFRRWDRPHPTL